MDKYTQNLIQCHNYDDNKNAIAYSAFLNTQYILKTANNQLIILINESRLAASVVSHVSWGGTELGISFDHLIHSIKKILFCCNLQCNKYTNISFQVHNVDIS